MEQFMQLRTVDVRGENPFITRAETGMSRERAIEVASHQLLRHWFPTTTPRDIREWSEIAQMDATVVVDELIEKGLITLNEESNDSN